MIRLISCMAVVLCLLLVVEASTYAQTVEGFLGVPWGASKNQVVKAMQDRGLKPQAPFETHFWGEFAGYSAAYLTFEIERNSFYQGSASVCHTEVNTGYNQIQSCGQNLEGMLRNKYGTPAARRQTHSNAHEITWAGIRSSTGSDDITIALWVSYPDKLNGGMVQVRYKNNSLLQRLKKAGASDL